MLAAALGGKASTNKLETVAPNPVLTSRLPPVRSETGLVHFPSPPSSPVKEAPSRLLGSVGTFGPPASRSSPMRRETAGSAASLPASAPPPARSTSPASGSSSAVQKRDMLSERLRAVTAASASAERVGVVEKLPQQEKKTPPPAAFATATACKAFHRRSSSDIISPPKWTWADDRDNYRDSMLECDLADMLGGGIALVTRDGTATPKRSKSLEKKKEEEEHHDKDSIVPIVIKQRSPPPSFSVTSRPAHSQNRSIGILLELGSTPPRQRSSTLVPMSSLSTFGGSTASGTTTASTTTSSSSRSPPLVASPPIQPLLQPTACRAPSRCNSILDIQTLALPAVQPKQSHCSTRPSSAPYLAITSEWIRLLSKIPLTRTGRRTIGGDATNIVQH
ncbi:hypothetical protein K438DRAFT_527702 [Mycena galopus ATCC 62051]|nr:hypothetical protein K438DRAFT_527702 [Mycena galopus ATCC 62051]